MKNAGNIISRTAIYGIGTILRGLASFILLPLYTSYLTAADYGLVELLSIVLDLTILLLGSRVAVGVFKFYSDAPDAAEKNRVIGSALFLMLIANAVALVVLFFTAEGLSIVLQAPEGFDNALRVFALSIVFGGINEIYYGYLRIEDHPVQYVAANLFKLITQIALNIFFIVYMGMGYWGIILGTVLSNAIQTTLFALWLMPGIGFRIGRTHCRNLVTFSLPIILSSLGMYYITFGDRYFIQYFQGIDAVGVYALAYKFGFMLFALVWAPFSTFWSAQQFDYAKQPGAAKLFGNVFFFTNILLVTAAAGISVLAPHFIHLFSQPGYWGAIDVIPWIVAAYVIQCWTEYMRFGILQAAQTRYIAYATFITVFFITLFYIYWIPHEGPVGAAKATLAAFIIRFGFVYFYAQRLFPIAIPWVRLISLLMYFTIISFSLVLLKMPDKWAFFVKGFAVALGLFVLFLTPIVSSGDRENVWLYVRQNLKGIFRRCSSE
ncbi:MAG: oligosaccharide flippase family protein [Gammaproteobacteria bacterium]